MTETLLPTLLTILITTALLFLIYLSLPKPLPGSRIPYNHASTRRVLGDLPALITHYCETGDLASFVSEQCRKLGSPVAQLFLWPVTAGRRPVVVVDDVREVEDLAVRRTGEFASSSGGGGLGLHPMVLDAGRTACRGWWEEVMKPEVLRKAVAEKVQRCAEELVTLWKKKCELSRGRPFDAREDVVVASMEAVWAALMGERGADGLRDEIASVKVHRAGQDAEEWEEDYGSDDLDQPVWFRGASRSVLYRAVEYFSGSSASVVWALFPGLRRLLLWLMPQYRAYKLVKNREIGKAVTEARKRVEKSKGEDGPAATKDNDTCAVDFVLRNEIIPQAKSEKSASKLNDRTLRDEFSMFLISAHQTTAALLLWTVKLLTNNQPQQSRLRDSLRAAFPSIPPTSDPSAEDILTASIPYLDATLEEILRLANPVPLLSRTAVVDTTILGFPIPKGTQVLCSTDFKRDPVVEVAEEKRSESSRAAGQGLVAKGLDQFMPERWIKVDMDGKRTFDPAALPRLSFGVEERRCPGRELAIQQLRIFLVLLVWNFQLDTIPDALNSQLMEGGILRRPQQCFVRLERI
ncbi:hypothetical protein VTJ04DRAFT_4991 [Mycothermus thermophilus]|uniref:uncharacterized protein n=1 Tax=Humicola insolens TaxID=85995 RepID=UPI003742BF36